jgi:hypothetical protein
VNLYIKHKTTKTTTNVLFVLGSPRKYDRFFNFEINVALLVNLFKLIRLYVLYAMRFYSTDNSQFALRKTSTP